MGMGTGAAMAYTISTKQVRMVVGDKIKELEDMFKSFGAATFSLAEDGEGDVEWEEFFKAFEYEEEDDFDEWVDTVFTHDDVDDYDGTTVAKLMAAAKAIFETFDERTGGVGLYVVRNSEPGCYDELDGGSFAICNIHQDTPAYTEFKEKFGDSKHAFWTWYG